MANANAIVEKLKDVGLRHGEKAAVAIASMTFLVCVGLAANKETINTTPEQVKKAAQASESNLNRPEKREAIVEKLAEKGIKDSEFAKVVEEQVKTALVADNYKPAREFVTPEPGAGLIRDTPALIKVTELYVYPGRGGLLVYQLDKEGNHVPDKDWDKEPPKPRKRRKRKRRVQSGGMMGGMMGGKKKKKGKSKAEILREEKEEAIRLEKVLKGKLVMNNDKGEDAAEEKEVPPEFPDKEITKGYRWVAITGVLDHAKLVANYRTALKNPAVAHPNYRRLDLQRQTLDPDGSWSKWENVSQDENLKILDNLPELDEELALPNVRPENLVDPLPFMKAGLWEKVHIASLVPREKKVIPKKDDNQRGGMGGRRMGAAGIDARDEGQAMQSMGSRSRMGRGGMGGGMMGGMMGGNESAGNYWRTDAKKIMIRGFDFTVQEDTTYRYRVRIVVWNPNLGREDIDFDVDNKAEELRGPWSDQTDLVAMPPDIMPYAMASSPPSPGADMKVTFQVIRFHPDTGVTIPRHFDAAPGEVIGEPKTADIPSSDGTGKKPKTIDFNSHEIMLDVFANKKSGGYQQLPTGFIGPPFIRPAVALVLRPDDGSVMVHNEADDEANEVRRDIDANYKHELSLSTKKRSSNMGAGSIRMKGGGMGTGR